MSDFETALNTFVAGCQKIVDEYHAKMEYNWKTTLSIDPAGRRYVRIVTEDHGQSSVYCFVDTTNGDVLMSASWKKPAKHARGNIFAPDNGLGFMTPHGAAYLR